MRRRAEIRVVGQSVHVTWDMLVSVRKTTLLHKEKLNTSALPQDQLVLFVLGKELMKLESCTEIDAQETVRQPSLALLGFCQFSGVGKFMDDGLLTDLT